MSKREIHKGLRNQRKNIFHKRFTDQWMEKDRMPDDVLQSIFNPILQKTIKLGSNYGANIPHISQSVKTTLPTIRF